MDFGQFSYSVGLLKSLLRCRYSRILLGWMHVKIVRKIIPNKESAINIIIDYYYNIIIWCSSFAGVRLRYRNRKVTYHNSINYVVIVIFKGFHGFVSWYSCLLHHQLNVLSLNFGVADLTTEIQSMQVVLRDIEVRFKNVMLFHYCLGTSVNKLIKPTKQL